MNINRRTVPILLAIVYMLVLAPDAHAIKQSVPPGSYLETPVSNINELCDQIKKNPKVSARFSKHFGLSAQEITAYLGEQVKMTKLTKSGRYTEYFIDVRGRMSSHVKLLPAGTPVLVLADGTPIMDMRCGNPMFKKLPKPVVKVQPKEKIEVVSVVQETPPPQLVVEVPQMMVEYSPLAEPIVQVLNSPPQEFIFSPATGLVALLPLLGGGGVVSKPNPTRTIIPELPSGVLGLFGSAVVAVPCFLRRRR